MRKGVRNKYVVLGVVAVAVVGAASISLANASTRALHSAKAPHHIAATRQAVQKHYRLLSQARLADVSSGTQLVNPVVVENLQLNIAETRIVQTSGGPVWIIPGNNGTCALWGQTAATTVPQGNGANWVGCADNSALLTTGLTVLTRSSSAGEFVFGFVPNGNSSVSAVSAAGSSVVIPVVDNAFASEVPVGNLRLTFKDAAGATSTTSLTLPSTQ
jgi:hypothetical protein